MPGATFKTRDTFAMGRGEIDVTDRATVYGAIGFHESGIDFVYAPRTVIDGAGDDFSRAFKDKSTFDPRSLRYGLHP